MDWQQTTFNSAGGAAFLQWIRTPAAQRDRVAIGKSVAATEPLLALLDAHLFTRQLSVDFFRSVPILCGWKKKTDAS
jgi:hypothetical protein